MTPKQVFIIPYRDREYHKAVFLSHMLNLLKNNNHYEFCFVHQNDKNPFNRGAMKNIGFIYYKKKYPNNWKDISFIFHDIDIVPYKNLYNYNTTKGVISHLYGYKNTLGGIFVIKGIDFWKVNGFPNYWGWGFEDNKLLWNWNSIGGEINYDQFISHTDNKIIKFDATNTTHIGRTINKNNLLYAVNETMAENGISTIKNLVYDITNERKNILIINVIKFLTKERAGAAQLIHNVTPNMLALDRWRRIRKHSRANLMPMLIL